VEENTMKHLIALIAGIMLQTTAGAALINIDFGPTDKDVYAGQGILGGATDTFWNAVDSTGATNLSFADSTAGTSGVSLTFNAIWSNVGASATNTLLGDRIIRDPNQGAAPPTETITISGLTPNSIFDIVLYNGFFAQQYSIIGQTGVGSASITPDADSPSTDFPNWTEGVEYARLNSAMSDGSGQLQIQDLPIAGGLFGVNSALAGLQIQDASQNQEIAHAPIPPALLLFGSGLLGLIGISRRKKAV
jgi:hypothetical protein